MDAKITKLRLSRMLSYDWLKIVGTAAAFIIAWTLIFTMTATRILPSQQFTVCNYVGNVSFTRNYTDSLTAAYKDGIFSYEVIEYNTEDLTVAQDAASQLLQARTSVNELDLIFVSMQDDPSSAYENTNSAGEKETLYRQSYLQSFLNGYRFNLHNLALDAENGFFKRMEGYLNRYYNGDYKNAPIDEGKIEQDFRARVKKNKDKRYKKEAEIQVGVQGEIECVKKYRAALVSFYEYLDAGYISLTTVSYIDENAPDYSWEGTYAINVCPQTTPSVKQQENLSRLVGYRTKTTDENGDEQNAVSAWDMNVCLFDSNGDDFAYEGLVYVTHLVKSIIAE